MEVTDCSQSEGEGMSERGHVRVNVTGDGEYEIDGGDLRYPPLFHK